SRLHTVFKCDWSSDVCSSDLLARRPSSVQSISLTADQTVNVALTRGADCSALTFDGLRASDRFATYTACGFTVAASTSNWGISKIGRASCRQRLGKPGVAGSV